eukprot:TRINITY_DN51158_c0_g1_i2.p1 TRINITY_DN51158_c0_g1~~TRINITY_DN51158_c0_g1_i2.p1  ORF type:complete len:185 (-),score=50.66 TRINITY_DN51158_c0_g1_i2:319-873(-)
MLSSPRPLWGGAVSVSLPERFIDISQFRDVPDFQEAFTDPHADQCVTFETLELLPEFEDDKIALHHWEQLMEHNEALPDNTTVSSELRELKHLPGVVCSVVVGNQLIAKHKEGEIRNRVRLAVFIVRLREQETDLLISISTPIEVHEESTSKDAPSSLSFGDPNDEAARMFLESFQIHDYGLFA